MGCRRARDWPYAARHFALNRSTALVLPRTSIPYDSENAHFTRRLGLRRATPRCRQFSTQGTQGDCHNRRGDQHKLWHSGTRYPSPFCLVWSSSDVAALQDFRSENGLYSLIQAQFDVAASRQHLQQDTPSQTDSDNETRSPEDGRSPKRRRLSHEDSIEVRAGDLEEASSESAEPPADSITVCQSPEPSSSDTTLELPSSCTIEVEVKEETIVCTPQPVRQAIHVALPMSSSPLSSPPLEDYVIPPSAFRPRSPPSSLPQRRTRSRVAELSLPPSSSPLSSPPPLCYDPYQTQALSEGSPSRRSSTSQSDLEDSFAMRLLDASQGSTTARTSLPNMKGKDLFDASIWSDPLRTSVFYTFATSLRQKIRDCEPTTSHRFISHLRDRGKLVRCYTQNIDRIEEKVGLSTSLKDGPGSKGRFSRRSTTNAAQLSKMVDEVTDSKGSSGPPASQSQSDDDTRTPTEAEQSQTETFKAPKMERSRSSGVECVFLHGSLECLRCFRCGLNTTWDDGREMETMSGQQPECPHCIGATAAREERGKRALGVGKLRPDIVLYGEEHPNADLIGPIVTHDISLCPDLLLILGTSLRVHGLKVMVREFANAIHNRGGKVVFVNFTKPPESSWGDFIDYWVQWDCDAWVADLQNRVPKLWEASLPPKEKPPAKNPVAMRDSRANGAWCTKKVMDELSRITGYRQLVPDASEADLPKAAKSSKKAEKRLSIEGTIKVQTTEELDEEPPKDAVIIVQEPQATAGPDAGVIEATIEVSQKPTVAQKATRPRRARKSAPGALERVKKKPPSTLNPNHGRASKIVAPEAPEIQVEAQPEPQTEAPAELQTQSQVESQAEPQAQSTAELKVEPDPAFQPKLEEESHAELSQSESLEPPSSPLMRDLNSAVGSILRSVKDNPRIRKRKRIYGDDATEWPSPKMAPSLAPQIDAQKAEAHMLDSDTTDSIPVPPKKSTKSKRLKTDSSPEMNLPSLQNMQPPPPLQNGEPLPPMQKMQPPTPPQLDSRPPPIEPVSPPQGPPRVPFRQLGRGGRRISANLQREIDGGMQAAQMHRDAMDRKFKWQPSYKPSLGQKATTPTSASTPPSLPTPRPPPAPLLPPPPPSEEVLPRESPPPPRRAVDPRDSEAAESMVQMRFTNRFPPFGIFSLPTLSEWLPRRR